MNIIKPSKLSPEEKQKLIQDIISRYNDSSDYYQDKFDTWVRCYKIYKAISDAVDDEEEVNIFIPYAFGLVEDVMARIADPIIEKLPIKAVAINRKYQQNADKLIELFRTYITSPQQIEQFVKSEKEKVITGSAWEKDEWANEWLKGKQWQETTVSEIVNSVIETVDKVIPIRNAITYKKLVEVEKLYPKKVGYITKYPSVFNVFPEPRVKDYRDLNWIIEIEDDVPIRDLMNAKYVDENGNLNPIYDLSELLKDYDNEIDRIEPDKSFSKSMHSEIINEVAAGRSSVDLNSGKKYKKGKVFLMHLYELDRIVTIANGKYIIKYIKDPFHVPKIPFRLRVYTPDPISLYGIGAIEPVEHLFYELNDIHRLSMRSWIRIVNGLVAYHKDAVPFPDDWKLESGGKVRIDPGVGPNIHNVIASIPLQDPTPTMIIQESNSKGLIERITSVPDLSPGVKGTKAYNKTATGLLSIQNAMLRRFSIIRKMLLVTFIERLKSFYDLCEQFLFEPAKARIYTRNGVTLYPDITREDILCEGGIDFMIINDPSFGDDAAQRNQLMVLLELLMKYETFRLKIGDQSMLKAKITEVIKKIIESFGWNYGDELLEEPDNVLSPDIEYQLIRSGEYVSPNPKENLTKHLIEHTAQLMSPQLKDAVERGKLSPDIVNMLKKHIEETINLIAEISQDPTQFASEETKKELLNRAINKKDIQYEKENIMPMPQTTSDGKGISTGTGDVVNANI